MPHKSVEDLIEALKKCPESTRVGKVSWEFAGIAPWPLDEPWEIGFQRQPRLVTIEVMTNVDD